jgi:HSP20 family protein
MANIARRDEPFGDLDDMFSGLFLRPMRFGTEAAPSQMMKVDVSRTEDTYILKAELPGIPKDRISVSIDGNEVTISGEVTKEREDRKGEEVVRSERYYGRVSRAFTLPHDIDEGKADAQYRDGVLELTLPKKNKSTSRQLEIH